MTARCNNKGLKNKHKLSSLSISENLLLIHCNLNYPISWLITVDFTFLTHTSKDFTLNFFIWNLLVGDRLNIYLLLASSIQAFENDIAPQIASDSSKKLYHKAQIFLNNFSFSLQKRKLSSSPTALAIYASPIKLANHIKILDILGMSRY